MGETGSVPEPTSDPGGSATVSPHPDRTPGNAPPGRPQPGTGPGAPRPGGPGTGTAGRGHGTGHPPGAGHEASRRWWSRTAAGYYASHGDFLGDADLVWGPEGVTEDELGLLGPVRGRDMLEFGCGAGQGSRWARARGARCAGLDLAEGMLSVAARIDAQAGTTGCYVQADAVRMPFADDSFDIVFSAYGATPFVEDAAALMRECARVLRPGGRLVFSTSHPFRWAFPDGPAALEATMSYFDRAPYAEFRDGRLDYAEYHRTVGDFVRAIAAAGLLLTDLAEPEWPQWNTATWGGWSPLRGAHIPGTAIFSARALP